MKLAHIINPVVVPPSSDLFVAQPVTFETMRIAKDFAQADIDVSLFTAQFPEDRPMIPDGFTPAPDLDRSVLDVATFKKKRKLPLLRDILDRLYEAAPDADYLAYTNVDIALMPYFYITVSCLAGSQHDAFAINRRSIVDKYRGIRDIPLLYGAVGRSHGGFDCFIFKKDIYPQFRLGNACIGAGGIGKILLSNMAFHSRSFSLFKDMHLTFHIGDRTVWRSNTCMDYSHHNWTILKSILEDMEKKSGRLDRNAIPGCFLQDLEGGRFGGFGEKLRGILKVRR